VITGKCSLACGCLYGGRVSPYHEYNCFLSHSFPFVLSFLSFDIFLLCCKGIVEGHCPGLVTRGDSVIHKSVHENEKVGL
jgi:hypothetical protein